MDEIRFYHDAELYSDRDYFQNIAGGFNNVGFGTAIVSFSLGWNRSTYSLQMKKVKGAVTEFQHICIGNEAIVVGYVAFPRKIGDTLFNGIQETLRMHGTEWISSIVCAEEPRMVPNLTETLWSVVYFREDSLSIPKEWFERMPQPINIFGDVVPTPMGGKHCIMKARAAAIIIA